nr:MAG TPA: hypothetical protein [Caudoviricetes sp.]
MLLIITSFSSITSKQLYIFLFIMYEVFIKLLIIYILYIAVI